MTDYNTKMMPIPGTHGLPEGTLRIATSKTSSAAWACD